MTMRSTLQVPDLGMVAHDDALDWYVSDPVAVPALGGHECAFALEAYEDDPDRGAFHRAIGNFLHAGAELLQAATPHVFRYYQNSRLHADPEDRDFPVIASAADVWRHVSFSDTIVVGRRPHADHGVYLSLECACDWEAEHGLQIVFHNGSHVNKVGPFDGHLSNADAFDDPSLEGVVYY